MHSSSSGDAPLIEVSHLDVVFGRGEQAVRAVHDASFHVMPGETFGLVGESGSGKSTVLRALSGLNPDWSGSLRLAGQELGTTRGRAFYKQLQMVFQDPYGCLHPRHTVDRALGEPARIHGLDKLDRRIEQALVDVGLGPSFRFRYPHQLSGGQRHRRPLPDVGAQGAAAR